MSQFKVGDRVEIGDVPTDWWFKKGWQGTVSRVIGPRDYHVSFDHKRYGLERDDYGIVEAKQMRQLGPQPDPTDYRGYYDAITEHSLPPAEPQDQ